MDAPPGTTDIFFPLLMCGTWAAIYAAGRLRGPWIRLAIVIPGMLLCLANVFWSFHWFVPAGIGHPASKLLSLGMIGCALAVAFGRARAERAAAASTKDG